MVDCIGKWRILLKNRLFCVVEEVWFEGDGGEDRDT